MRFHSLPAWLPTRAGCVCFPLCSPGSLALFFGVKPANQLVWANCSTAKHKNTYTHSAHRVSFVVQSVSSLAEQSFEAAFDSMDDDADRPHTYILSEQFHTLISTLVQVSLRYVAACAVRQAVLGNIGDAVRVACSHQCREEKREREREREIWGER